MSHVGTTSLRRDERSSQSLPSSLIQHKVCSVHFLYEHSVMLAVTVSAGKTEPAHFFQMWTVLNSTLYFWVTVFSRLQRHISWNLQPSSLNCKHQVQFSNYIHKTQSVPKQSNQHNKTASSVVRITHFQNSQPVITAPILSIHYTLLQNIEQYKRKRICWDLCFSLYPVSLRPHVGGEMYKTYAFTVCITWLIPHVCGVIINMISYAFLSCSIILKS